MSVNQSVLRDINTGLIMRMILEHAPISRTELVDRSGLAPSTVTHITSDLQEKNLIRECGRANSNGGRRPILLEVNPDGGCFLGVELNVPVSSVGILDLTNKLVKSWSFLTPVEGDDAAYVLLVERISDALNWCRREDKEVLGIGVGATGLIDSVRGTVVESTNLGWENFYLLDRLKRIFNHSITFENEANAAAYGEYVRCAQEFKMKNVMYVAVGSGIGCGIIINGNLFTGTLGMAGEIGHISVEPNGPHCRCGKHGCLEVVSSGSAMLRQYVEKTGKTHLESAVALLAEADSGDSSAREIVSRAGRVIGMAIGNQINVLNLDTVILGGELMNSESLLFQEIRDSAIETVLLPMRDGLEIRLSTLKRAAGVIGAATMSWKQMFA